MTVPSEPKREVILTPWVTHEVSVDRPDGLVMRLAVTDDALRGALRQALGRGRRFTLKPAPKDW